MLLLAGVKACSGGLARKFSQVENTRVMPDPRLKRGTNVDEIQIAENEALSRVVDGSTLPHFPSSALAN
jgi:hypothetical protein